MMRATPQPSIAQWPSIESKYRQHGAVHWNLLAGGDNDYATRAKIAVEKVRELTTTTSKVLDVGCGDGAILGLLSPYCLAHGIDHDEVGVGIAIGKGLSAEVASVYDCCLTGEWDVVLLADVIEHLVYARQALDNMRRLSPLVVLTTPLWDQVRPISRFHTVEYTEKVMGKLAKNSHWTIRSLEKYHMPHADREDMLVVLAR